MTKTYYGFYPSLHIHILARICSQIHTQNNNEHEILSARNKIKKHKDDSDFIDIATTDHIHLISWNRSI